MSDRVLMPIGRFAQSCRLSVKALRHYDELGILKPALVDASSGYRYYTRRQAGDAVVVSLLRSLGLPLSAIGEILTGSPERQQSLLALEAGRLEDELRQRADSLHAIQRLLREGTLRRYDRRPAGAGAPSSRSGRRRRRRIGWPTTRSSS